MPIDTTYFQRDIINVIADLPAVFQFSGIVGGVGLGSLTDLETTQNLEVGGYISEFKAALYVNITAFSVLPVAGNTIGIGGVIYRVDNTSKSADGVGIRIDLVTPDI